MPPTAHAILYDECGAQPSARAARGNDDTLTTTALVTKRFSSWWIRRASIGRIVRISSRWRDGDAELLVDHARSGRRRNAAANCAD